LNVFHVNSIFINRVSTYYAKENRWSEPPFNVR